MLRRIFGHKGNEVTRGWKRLHNLYSNDQIKKNKMDGACRAHDDHKCT
jgi:hypothetical protein